MEVKEIVNTFSQLMSGRNMQNPLLGGKWRVHLKRQFWKRAYGCGNSV